MAVVYEHVREDTGEVFYVGFSEYDEEEAKGTWRPMSGHKRSDEWKEVAQQGWSTNIVQEGLDMEEALQLEVDLIAEYGRDNLVNKTDGGEFTIKGNATHCKRGHKYTDETTIITSEGWRHCKICWERNYRKRYRKQKRKRKLSKLPDNLRVMYEGKELEEIPKKIRPKMPRPRPTHCKNGHLLDENRTCLTCARKAGRMGGQAVKEMWEKKKAERTHCKRGHEWKEENLVLKKGKYWECRLCHNQLKRERKKKAKRI